MGVKIRFYDCEENNPITFLECKLIENTICIKIEDFNSSIPIILDRQTSIRLVRELRKQISELN